MLKVQHSTKLSENKSLITLENFCYTFSLSTLEITKHQKLQWVTIEHFCLAFKGEPVGMKYVLKTYLNKCIVKQKQKGLFKGV